MKDKEKIAKALAEIHDNLGHKKFHLVIKIFMDFIDEYRRENNQIKSDDMIEMFKKAIEVANIILKE